MRGIKPFKVSFLSRPFAVGREYRLGIAALAYFPLDRPGALLTDIEMWRELPELLGKDLLLDAGIPKSRAEVLVFGSAYQPKGVPAATRPVRVAIGGIDKTLYVIGDRTWERGVPTAPKPFVEMSLGWQNAFGGAEYPKNPLGKGIAPVKIDGRMVHPLPNLELPGKLIDSPGDRPEPAGLGPVDFTWPQRMALAGTYDKRWLDNDFPGFARDMDWRIWNTAAPDQQREAPFQGDETFVLEHLHPTKPKLEGRLPGLRARAFVRQLSEEKEVFREVDLRLTTVLLFPGIERGVLVFHGQVPVAEDDGDDITVLMVAAERLGEPRPLEHYQAVVERRCGPEGALEALNDQDLVPHDLVGMGPEVEQQMALTTPQGLRRARLREAGEAKIADARARLEALGLDPDEHGPKPLPDEPSIPPLSEVGALIKKIQSETATMREEHHARMAQARERGRKFYEEAGLDWAAVEKERDSPPRGPPPFSAEAERARFRKLADEAAASGHPSGELEHFATDDEVYARWVAAERQLKESYRTTAHMQRPAFGKDASESARRRATVEAVHGRGESLAGWDLTGVDLTGIDLTNADLTEAFLESVCFERAVLDGAKLNGAVLAHAKLDSASLRGASLRGANLGKASLVSIRAEGADLREAIVKGATLREADLSKACLVQAMFEDASLEGARLDEADLQQAVFMRLSLRGVSFVGASLKLASFIEVDASELDFSQALLEQTTFMSSKAMRSKFVNAKMKGFRVVLESNFEDGDFRGADLTGANLRGARMAKADLSGARLDKADLSKADLTEAKLYRAVARESMWIRACLRRAQMVSIDLFNAIVEKADLRGANLTGASLYGADFALIQSDKDTTVAEANQDRVRVQPTREG